MSLEVLYSIYTKHPVICTDTRKITPGCIFFALKGDTFDGNTFARQALLEGASYVVVDNPSVKEDDRYFLTNDVLTTLQELAAYHRSQLSIPVIGITGTNGKTTTKELLNSVLSQHYKTLATAGNLNNHIGVPLTLLSIGQDIELAIIEMGANHQKEIEALCNIARPTHGLITNVGKAHLEGFGGFEGVKKAKGELYDFLKATGGTIFINGENGNLLEMLGEKGAGNPVFYGSGEGAIVSGSIVENDPLLTVEWLSAGNSNRVKTHLTGTYNLENILAAITAGIHFGLSDDEINTGIRNYVPGNNRSQVIKTTANTLICDYYNANPSSMTVALHNLSAISASKKAVILGDMFELGVDAAEEHRKVADTAAQMDLSERIFIGDEFYRLKANCPGRFYRTTGEAYDALKKAPLEGYVVLVKGSRGMKLEQIVELL